MMKNLALAVTLMGCTVPGIAAGQSLFDGTWKIDLKSFSFSQKPDVLVLKDGVFECSTCNPKIKVKADGTDQPLTDNPYADTLAVTVVSDHEISQVNKKAGKVVGTSRTIISPDGKTMTATFSDSSNTNGGPPVTGTGKATRVADGPPGSHILSGSWRSTEMSGLSDSALVWSYKTDGDMVTMTNPTGQTYTAKMDGTEAAMLGDPGVTSVSVRLIGKDTLEETDKRKDKVIGVFRFTVAADGKSAKSVFEDKMTDQKTEFEAIKQ